MGDARFQMSLAHIEEPAPPSSARRARYAMADIYQLVNEPLEQLGANAASLKASLTPCVGLPKDAISYILSEPCGPKDAELHLMQQPQKGIN